jgi:hypothetical protein
VTGLGWPAPGCGQVAIIVNALVPSTSLTKLGCGAYSWFKCDHELASSFLDLQVRRLRTYRLRER